MNACEQGPEKLKPLLAQKKANRLIARIEGTFDDFSALRDENALFGLKDAPKLAFRELGIGLKPLVGKIRYAYDVNSH